MRSDAGRTAMVVNRVYWSEDIDFTIRKDSMNPGRNKHVCKDCGEQNRQRKANELTGLFDGVKVGTSIRTAPHRRPRVKLPKYFAASVCLGSIDPRETS